jgi:putative transposase
MKYIDEHFYHVYNRGSRSEAIFFSEKNYEYFLRLMKEKATAHLVCLVSYCLMPNHYHLVVQQNEKGSISKFIQSIMGSYVQAINKGYNTSGSLFQGKAKAKLIDSDEYVLQVIRYIHLNPVNAGLVRKPEEWPFSDYDTWTDTSPTAKSGRRNSLRDVYFTNGGEYRRFVEDYNVDLQKKKMDEFLFQEEQ